MTPVEHKAREHGIDGVKERDVFLADEEYVTLFVGNVKLARIFASPKDVMDLGVGFVVTEGLMDYGQITKAYAKGANAFIEAIGAGNLDVLTELRSSGCVGMTTEEPPPLPSGARFRREVIVSSLKLLNESSPTWRATGGTHTAVLVSEKGERVIAFEDIGRHNALDKVVGWALLNGVRLDDKFLLFTGRISMGIVYKAVRAGIPLLVSNTAGLSKAIQAAEKLNLATAGFARGERFTVYTHEERIA